MTKIVLNEKDYYSKVYGGWMGKNIGGTLGVPVEGKMELLQLDFYPLLPDEPLENDDLDLQLVWLHALEQYGAKLTSRELGQEWLEHIFFPFDEYGYALANLRRGLIAPVAGWFNNPFNDCMGSPIRSEIWAMVAPGAPARAAAYAFEDAIVDHAGGEGVWGEVFFAAIESAAFVESDRDALIELGLSYIPSSSRTALAVRDLLKWHQEGRDWIEARSLILEHHGRPNFTDAPQNIAFTILGWLYGEDFGDAILKAVNCGYDTDCTAATLGAILGIIGGTESLPERWVAPVGDRVVVSPPIKGFPAPKSLAELTERTIRVGREVIASWGLDVRLSTSEPTSGTLCSADLPPIMPYSPSMNRYLLPQGTSAAGIGISLTADYGDAGPSIGAEGSKQVTFTLKNDSGVEWKGTLELKLPAGWSASFDRDAGFNLSPGSEVAIGATIRHSGEVCSYYSLELLIHRLHDGLVWNTESVRFTLVAGVHWEVANPAGEVIQGMAAGNMLMLGEFPGTEASGTYRLSARVRIPSARKIRWIASTSAPVKLCIDGETRIDSREVTDFMPAFHRASAGKYADLFMAAGEYVLEVETEKSADPLLLAVVPVEPGATAVPGTHYFMADVVFLPNRLES